MRELMMVWVTMLVGLTLLAFGAHSTQSQPEASRAQEPAIQQPITETGEKPRPKAARVYPVVKVVDGDTVVIKKEGENVTLRLIGMDAPETTTLRKGTIECFGSEATRRAEELLVGVSVAIETDASQDTYDRYGRTLAYVFLPHGRNFAAVMIAEGYAHEYTYRLPYTHQEEFRTAQKDAQAEKRGLWADDACVRENVKSAAPAQSAGAAAPATSTIECSKNTYNCSSFKTQAEAQAAFDSCGGNENDVHKLDSDGDGRVCEGLP